MRFDEKKPPVARPPRPRLEHRAASRVWGLPVLGAIFGLSGGTICALFGSVLTAVSWFTGAGAAGSYVRTFGTALLVLTIPLLLFGAHCLDLSEKRSRREK